MADISDITTYLAGVVSAAVYPNGTGNASIAGMNVLVYEGWPISEQLDLDLQGKNPLRTGKTAHVSIFAPPNSSRAAPYQILDQTYVVNPAAINCTVAVVGDQITLTGTPAAGEFLTIVADRANQYSRGGASASVILSALLADVQAQYPSATLVGNTLTVPDSFQLDVRQGGVGLLGKVLHRECQNVMVTVWAPDHATRSTLAKAIDIALKLNIVVTLSAIDGSDIKIVYQRTNTIDERQNVAIYRRDLFYDVEYATVELYAGTSITTVQNQFSPSEYPDGNQETVNVIN